MKNLLVILCLSFLCSVVVGKIQQFGQPCSFQDETLYCTRSAGLFCDPESSTCKCLQGELDTKYSYNMEWDTGKKQCVGALNSACVNAVEGVKAVGCKSGLTCQQLPNYVESVGVCAEGQGGSGGAFTLQFSFGIFAILTVCRWATSF